MTLYIYLSSSNDDKLGSKQPSTLPEPQNKNISPVSEADKPPLERAVTRTALDEGRVLSAKRKRTELGKVERGWTNWHKNHLGLLMIHLTFVFYISRNQF